MRIDFFYRQFFTFLCVKKTYFYRFFLHICFFTYFFFWKRIRHLSGIFFGIIINFDEKSVKNELVSNFSVGQTVVSVGFQLAFPVGHSSWLTWTLQAFSWPADHFSSPAVAAYSEGPPYIWEGRPQLEISI